VDSHNNNIPIVGVLSKPNWTLPNLTPPSLTRIPTPLPRPNPHPTSQSPLKLVVYRSTSGSTTRRYLEIYFAKILRMRYFGTDPNHNLDTADLDVVAFSPTLPPPKKLKSYRFRAGGSADSEGYYPIPSSAKASTAMPTPLIYHPPRASQYSTSVLTLDPYVRHDFSLRRTYKNDLRPQIRPFNRCIILDRSKWSSPNMMATNSAPVQRESVKVELDAGSSQRRTIPTTERGRSTQTILSCIPESNLYALSNEQ
jgi:hypothetical protein